MSEERKVKLASSKSLNLPTHTSTIPYTTSASFSTAADSVEKVNYSVFRRREAVFRARGLWLRREFRGERCSERVGERPFKWMENSGVGERVVIIVLKGERCWETKEVKEVPMILSALSITTTTRPSFPVNLCSIVSTPTRRQSTYTHSKGYLSPT